MVRCPECTKDFDEGQLRELALPDVYNMSCPHCGKLLHVRCLQCNTEFRVEEANCIITHDSAAFKCPVCEARIAEI